MSGLTDVIQNLIERGAVLETGDADGVNSVAINGDATSVVLPAINPVVSGDHAVILSAGAAKVILGPVGDVAPIGIMLRRSTAQSIPNTTVTNITWGTSETYMRHRPDDFKAEAANLITIPTGLGGIYHVLFSGEWAANASGDQRQLYINISSNSGEGDTYDVYGNGFGSGSTITARPTASAYVALDDGAVLAARAYQNSGGALNVSNMRFQAVRIGG